MPPRAQGGTPSGARWLVVAVAGGSALVAFGVAQLGPKEMIAAIGALAVGFVVVAFRDRALALLLLLILSLQFLFHKSFGPIAHDVAGGASAIYITNIDALLVVLYVIWLAEGTMGRDIRRAMSETQVMVPLLAGLLVVPSILAATDLYLSMAELVRMCWMALLFLYVAARVRSRREVMWIVGALFVIACVQSTIAGLQWVTNSSLGLQLLGEEETLGVRTLDDGEVLRPVGTVVHAIFLAALVAPIGLLALSLAMELTRPRTRIALLLVAGVAFAPLVLSQTRAALVAAGVSVLLLTGVALWRRRITWRPVAAALVASVAVALLFIDQIRQRIFDNLGTQQFGRELTSRWELNDVALQMVGDSPLIGMGLNNFEAVMYRYDTRGLIFPDNPVHNIYLLVASETGVLGLTGLLVTLLVFLVVAVRLVRARDRLLAGIGAGIGAVLVFFVVEELISFALRQEMPLALFWIVGGLGVACLRIMREQETPETEETRAPLAWEAATRD